VPGQGSRSAVLFADSYIHDVEFDTNGNAWVAVASRGRESPGLFVVESGSAG